MPFWDNIYFHHVQGSSSRLKPPLVLIHGAAGNHLYWPHELRRMPGENVYGLDLPAHGKSYGKACQTISSYADAVHDWLNGMEISEAIFAGHSMGGAIALNLAIEYPDCVAGLILLGSGARLKVQPEIIHFAESQTTCMNAVRMMVRMSFSREASPRLVELAAERMGDVRQSVLFADLKACDRFDAVDRLSCIQKPSLILCGENDELISPRCSNFLAENISHSVLKMIPGAGHMLQLEKPQQTADIIKDYIIQMKK